MGDSRKSKRRPRTKPGSVTVRVACRSWSKVARLVWEHRRGRSQVCVRRPDVLEPGQPVTVLLHLPDELVLSLEATVVSTRRDPRSGEALTYFELVGLDGKLASRLEELCVSRAA
jgi:hypothetical protein